MGESKQAVIKALSKKDAMLKYADNCRHYIITLIEQSGIKTEGLHNLEISTFLSRIYWIENSIQRQVKRSKDVFQACAQILKVINKLNNQQQ